MPTSSPDQTFRRQVRRLTANFISQEISHAQFVSAVRAAAVTAGILESRRPTRDDRMLNALAWGKGTIEPGRLHTLLEPLFQQLVTGQIQREVYAQRVRRLLDQIKVPDVRVPGYGAGRSATSPSSPGDVDGG